MKKDLFSSLVANGIVAIVMFISLPIIYRVFGTFTFSLFSYYLIIFGWLSVFDAGITPILSRCYVRLKSSKCNSIDIKTAQTFNSLPYVLGAGMLVIGMPLTYFILKEIRDVNALEFPIFGIIIAMAITRYLTISIKGAITGLGGFGSLGIVSIIAALLRFMAPPFALPEANPLEFFIYQLVVNIVEIFALNAILINLKNRYCNISLIGMNLDVIKSNAGTLLSVGIPSLIWAFTNQYDKTIFAAKLSAPVFSEIMLMLGLATAIGTFVSPLSSVMTQKITEKIAHNTNCGEFVFNSLSCYCALILTISCPLIFFGKNIFYIWTGYELPNEQYELFLICYAIANAIASLNGFAYVVQASAGQFKYHLYSNFIYAAILLPLVPISYSFNDYLGVAISIAFLNLLFFCGYLLLYLYSLRSTLLRNMKLRHAFNSGLLIFAYYLFISNCFQINNVSRVNTGILIAAISLLPLLVTFRTLRRL